MSKPIGTANPNRLPRQAEVTAAVANLRNDLAEEYEILDAAGKRELLRLIEAAAAELRRA